MAKILPIIKFPHPLLRKRAREIRRDELAHVSELITNMKHTMKRSNGIGIAAPQVDQTLRIICISHQDGIQAFINPKLSHKSLRKETGEEGCLSIPGIFGIVKRHKYLSYTAWDETGKKIFGKAHGLFARVLQHEVDHLDGILFIDRAEKITHGTIDSAI